MDDIPVTRTVSDLRTKDPIDVLAGLDRHDDRRAPVDREYKSGFEAAWDLAH